MAQEAAIVLQQASLRAGLHCTVILFPLTDPQKATEGWAFKSLSMNDHLCSGAFLPVPRGPLRKKKKVAKSWEAPEDAQGSVVKRRALIENTPESERDLHSGYKVTNCLLVDYSAQCITRIVTYPMWCLAGSGHAASTLLSRSSFKPPQPHVVCFTDLLAEVPASGYRNLLSECILPLKPETISHPVIKTR